MNKQRILFLHLGQSFGGIEVYMANLAALLRDHAEIIALCSHPHLSERLAAEGVLVVRLPHIPWLTIGPLRGLRFLLAALMLPFLLVRHRVDQVHINGHWESMLLLPCRIFGKRTISTRHQTWDIPLEHWWHAPKRTLASLVYHCNARFADSVICVSEAVASEMRRYLHAKRVVVIPNWVACQPSYQARPAIQSKTRILFIGRLVVFKGLQLVIEALRGLPNVSLTVVGEGAMLAQYREQAQGLDVTFAGFHKDVQPFYRAADIFVMPSIGLEGLPLVSLEAMGHGLPCLFSDLPVHHEITANGQAAALFRTGDAKDLQGKLRKLIEDAVWRSSLALAAYNIVERRYTTAAARRDYLRVFALHGATTTFQESTDEDSVDLSQRSAATE